MTTRIPTESEYQRAELARFRQEMSGGSPDTSEFLDYCRNYTDTVLERIDWLLAGHYGQGALLAYRTLGPYSGCPKGFDYHGFTPVFRVLG